ncbi:MAG: SDR family oxidoreductase [Verrucomicrobiales bacterium]|nr:SDR family oxidoreductase [Verrucomicrobiales bacterium]
MSAQPEESPQQVILVTGANGGLGLAICRAFLEHSAGNFVWLAVNHRRDAAALLASEFPGRADLVDLDVTVESGWTEAVEVIVSRHGRLDVLVNNAGRHEDALLATMSSEQWSRVLDVNLHSVFLGCRAVIRSMMGRRFGRIINIASLSALLAPPGQTNYAAAKAGVIGLTQSLAKETARAGITVNGICPGYIETDALSSMTPEERMARCREIPMRRFGRPEEVAAAVRFLASEEAGYITGAVLKIDGGIF